MTHRGKPAARRARLLVAVLLGSLLLAPLPLRGVQDPPAETELTPEAIARIVAFYNDPGTVHLEGGGEIPSGATVGGSVAVLAGDLTVAGEIAGDLIVINGDLRIVEDGRITGDATVVGGRIGRGPDAAIGGRVTVHSDRLRYVRDGRRIEPASPRDEEGLSSSLGFGRSRLTVRAGTNYSRVEGLPVLFGPVIETESANPLRLGALGIWRSDNGFDFSTEKMGHRVLLEQFLGGRRAYSVGAVARSLVEPLERWALADLESSLATFLFHRDHRDYLERTGWYAFATVRPERLPFDFRLEYRDEEHRFASVGSPWSLKANDEPWRPQPLVAEGRLRSVRGSATVDTRNDRDEPTHGWWIRLRAERPVGGALRIREHLAPFPGEEEGPVAVPPRPVGTDFTAGFADLRRYNRVSPRAELVIRAVLGGSLSGDPLPPQFQHALGGEGSIPGFRVFSVDCGARLRTVGLDVGAVAPERASPAYGCDRMALFQAEFRRDLGTGPVGPDVGGWHEGWESGIRLRPRIAAFLNAGRGWALGGPGDARFDETTRLDAGLGLLFRRVGVYLAVPLGGGDGGRVNLLVRLDRRF